ncbi:M10 family metallopeptidase C-terminal domain-containing protein [Microvirga alba]|nr:hypothetical protein [Microvirga alba]
MLSDFPQAVPGDGEGPPNTAPTQVALTNTSVVENVPVGTIIGYFSAKDKEQPLSKLVFSLVESNPILEIGGNGATGYYLYVKDNNYLDYESPYLPFHTIDITVECSDGLASTLKRFSIQILNANERPTDILLSNFSVVELASNGAVVADLFAVDPEGAKDIADISVVDVANSAFDVTKVWNELGFWDFQLVVRDRSKLDYEKLPGGKIKVKLVATDKGGLSFEKEVTIDVIDLPEPPRDIRLSATQVREGASGQFVGELSAEADFGDEFIFTLKDAATSPFYISSYYDSALGKTVYQLFLRDGSKIDYETTPGHKIDITVLCQKTSGGIAVEQKITLDIVDVDEAPSLQITGDELLKDSPNGTMIGTVSAIDPEGGIVNFVILGAYADAFNVVLNEETGQFELRVEDASLIDYSLDFIDLMIVASDLQNHKTERYVTVKIVSATDGPYNISLSNNTVDEQAPNQTVVGVVSAMDRQGDAITYSVAGAMANVFEVVKNPTTGLYELRVKDGSKIDYETADRLPVTIVADDGHGHVSRKDFEIIVNDVNEAPENLRFIGGEFLKGSSDGTVIGIVSAKDPEGDPITYTLSGALADAFKVEYNAATRAFQLKLVNAGLIDYNSITTINLTLSANDGHGHIVEKPIVLTTVTPNGAPYNISLSDDKVAHHAADFTLVGVVSAIDPEGDDITYSIAGGTLPDAFWIVKNEAWNRYELRVKDGSKIDYDTVYLHQAVVTILADDGHGHVSQKNFTIGIEKPGSGGPTDAVFSDGGFVAELSSSGTYVGTLSAAGAGMSGALTYTLLEGTDAFELDPTANNVLLVKNGVKLDYEFGSEYAIKVLVKDSAGRELVVSTKVDILNLSTEIMRVGAATDDKIKATGGKDVLIGGEGNDTLWGGLGNDKLTGGGGKDVFVFDTKPSDKNIDTITDFNKADDMIHLQKAGAFTLLTRGALSAAQFHVGAEATDEFQRIIYDDTTGFLYYDADGSGTDAKAVQFAILQKAPDLSHTNFLVI